MFLRRIFTCPSYFKFTTYNQRNIGLYIQLNLLNFLLEGGLGHAIQLLDRLGLTPSQEDLATITPREVSSRGPLAVSRIIKAKQESRKTINRVRGKGGKQLDKEDRSRQELENKKENATENEMDEK
jgi:hypothetical protein